MTKLGLKDHQLELLNKIVLIPARKQGFNVWAFGSRARGDHKEFSDLDLLVSREASKTTLSEMREALEESTLPIKVDIVPEDELVESYKSNVIRDRILLV